MEQRNAKDVDLLNKFVEGLIPDDGDGESLIEQTVCSLVGEAEGSIESVAERLGARTVQAFAPWRQAGRTLAFQLY